MSSEAKEQRHAVLDLALELGLTGLACAWDELLACATEKEPGYSDFALGLLRYEREVRQQRRRERNLKRSRLGPCEGLEGYDFSLRAGVGFEWELGGGLEWGFGHRGTHGAAEWRSLMGCKKGQVVEVSGARARALSRSASGATPNGEGAAGDRAGHGARAARE